MYHSADVDGDGVVTRMELAGAIVSSWSKTDEEARSIVNEIDADGNDLIALHEFLGFLANFPGWEGLRM